MDAGVSTTKAAALTLTEHLCPSFLKLCFLNQNCYFMFVSFLIFSLSFSNQVSNCSLESNSPLQIEVLFEDSFNTAVGFHETFSCLLKMLAIMFHLCQMFYVAITFTFKFCKSQH